MILFKILQLDHENGCVYRVHWEASLRGKPGKHRSAFTFEKKEKVRVPLEDLTDSTAVKWIKDRLGDKGMVELKQKLEKK
jgi:hypothetical protein